MSRSSFEYVIYVRAAPDEVWNGLIDPELTRRYWRHENVSDWEPGSEWRHESTDEPGQVDIAGEVLEADRPHRLEVTWAQPEHRDDPEKTSRVAFELEPQEWPGGPWTRLALAHTELEPGSEMAESIAWGWPAVCSGLKTLVEWPGEDLPF